MPKKIYFLPFLFRPQYLKIIDVEKGTGRVYKHIHNKWPYPPPTTTFVAPPRSVSSSQNDSTSGCCDSTISPIQPYPISNLLENSLFLLLPSNIKSLETMNSKKYSQEDVDLSETMASSKIN